MSEPNRREFDLALELVTPPVPESTYRYVTGATYSGDDGAQHRYDAYLPTTVADRPPPVVIFVHGDGPPDFLREPRLWGQYRSWGKLAAAKGMAAITFDHGSTEGRTRIQSVLNEIGALLATVERDADTLGLDASRIAV